MFKKSKRSFNVQAILIVQSVRKCWQSTTREDMVGKEDEEIWGSVKMGNKRARNPIGSLINCKWRVMANWFVERTKRWGFGRVGRCRTKDLTRPSWENHLGLLIFIHHWFLRIYVKTLLRHLCFIFVSWLPHWQKEASSLSSFWQPSQNRCFLQRNLAQHSAAAGARELVDIPSYARISSILAASMLFV